MRIRLAACVLLAAALAPGGAQQIREEVGVLNVEVPVRVFQAGRFVDDLALADFELLEDGRPQALEAVYLVRKRAIERRDELRRFAPRTNRSFYLLFELSDYVAKLGPALDYFVRDVIAPGDTLNVATPMKAYRLKPQAFEARTRQEIGDQIKGLLRRDTLMGSAEYRDIIEDLQGLAQSIVLAMSQEANPILANIEEIGASNIESRGTSFDELLNRYASTLARLEDLRAVDQENLLRFAESLKADEGRKYVYLFYQREFIPKIDPKLLFQYIDRFQDRPDINQTISGIFEFYKREIPFNLDKVKQAYADASVGIHFLLLTTPAKRTASVVYTEQSEDIFSAFSQMAEATGGFVDSSANPESLMKSAVESSETYYLLYYSPRPYAKDGRFHEITVRIPGRELRITHRRGYVAD